MIDFLTSLVTLGLGYDSLNTARSALSSLGLTFEGFRVGCHPLVVRYMKGAFNLNPPKPRYSCIWDVTLVLTALRGMAPVDQLSLRDLTLKVTMLMALVQAARVQSLHMLSKDGYKRTEDRFIFMLNGSIKQNRPGYRVGSLEFKAYPPDERLCVYVGLNEYLVRTRDLRIGTGGGSLLLLSYVKPHGHVTRDTISRWIRTVLDMAGIDSTVYGGGSVRAAAVSKARANAVPLATIMGKAGWTREGTFARFYNKEIVAAVDGFQIGVLGDG